MRAAGLARGGSLDNAVVISGDRVLNAEGLRYGDEFVRHKVLDAMGDLYLAGGPIVGRFEGCRSGHALNGALLAALFADPTAWRLTTLAAPLERHGTSRAAPAPESAVVLAGLAAADAAHAMMAATPTDCAGSHDLPHREPCCRSSPSPRRLSACSSARSTPMSSARSKPLQQRDGRAAQ